MNKIKNYAIKKIVISTTCLLLFGLFYFYPTNDSIKTEINVNDNKTEYVIYMLDSDNYVSRVTMFFDSDSIIEEIKKKIDILTNGSEELYNFYPLIPKNTKLNSVKINKNEVTLDFSKEFLKVNKYLEESMIESILYTITEINGIDTVYINVENEPFRNYPNSHKDLPYPLKRSYGINKEYNLNDLNNVNNTTVFFSKTKDDYKYYVPITEVNNKNEEKIDIIIEELKSSVNAQNNLNSFLNQKTRLIDYKIDNKKIELNFNEYFFNNKELQNDLGFILTSSIFENYNVNEIIINNKYNYKRK